MAGGGRTVLRYDEIHADASYTLMEMTEEMLKVLQQEGRYVSRSNRKSQSSCV
jgi:hypothetical protein